MICGEQFQLLSEVSFHGELTDNIIIEQNNSIPQNLLKISDQANVIKNFIQPDFTNFKWKNDLDENYLKNAIKFFED